MRNEYRRFGLALAVAGVAGAAAYLMEWAWALAAALAFLGSLLLSAIEGGFDD